jgi:hypothetical protein
MSHTPTPGAAAKRRLAEHGQELHYELLLKIVAKVANIFDDRGFRIVSSDALEALAQEARAVLAKVKS